MSIGDQLHDLRIAAGLRQVDLAEKIGLNQGTISTYEKGRGLPSLTVLLAWIEACGGVMSIHRADAKTVPLHRLGERARGLLLRLASALEGADERTIGNLESVVNVVERDAAAGKDHKPSPASKAAK